MTALLIGTALAVASLCYVLYPLFRWNVPLAEPDPVVHRGEAGPSAVDALRELEFDRQTGKIADSDYGPLKARYTEEAVVALRAREVGRTACRHCGPRPEADAEFCSNCGSRIVG